MPAVPPHARISEFISELANQFAIHGALVRISFLAALALATVSCSLARIPAFNRCIPEPVCNTDK